MDSANSCANEIVRSATTTTKGTQQQPRKFVKAGQLATIGLLLVAMILSQVQATPLKTQLYTDAVRAQAIVHTVALTVILFREDATAELAFARRFRQSLNGPSQNHSKAALHCFYEPSLFTPCPSPTPVLIPIRS